MRAYWSAVAGVLFAAAPPLAAQGVLVAPHAVFIDHRVRSGSVLLYNPGTEPVEVTISTLFGYPVTDSAGRILLRTVDRPDSAVPSAAAWIQAFPRRLTVAPLERQTIRLLVTPPPTIPDGEYWARLVVAARGGAVPAAGVADTSAIKIGLTLEVRTIIAVNYRKGALRTGVRLSRLQARVMGDSVEVRARLERQGNAAYVGTMHGALVDSAGKVHGEFSSPIGVYYTLEPRVTAPVGALLPGRYRLRLQVTTQREDLAPEVVLPAPPVRDSLDVVVP
ncbi:MAG TPA: hypothetical protein VEM13_07495 [Gemmatimonadales bacterium]|nr:hypothetical protein [Gemmatimonadales bacterium]